jgi:hypothetical protein
MAKKTTKTAKKTTITAKKTTKQKQSEKQKQQKQSQEIIVNITNPKTIRRTAQQQPKQYLPTPSQPLTDLAKVLGMLIPKIQTESTLGASIPDKPKAPVPRKTNIGGLVNSKDVPSLGDAIKATVIEEPPKPVVDAEPIYETTVEGEDQFRLGSGDSERGFAPLKEAVFKKPSVPTTYLKIPEPRRSASKSKPEFSGDIKKYFQKRDEPLSIEEQLNSEVEYSKQFSQPTGYSSSGSQTVERPIGKYLGTLPSESESEISRPARKISNVERLIMRYELVTGKDYKGYSGSLKDFRELIKKEEEKRRIEQESLTGVKPKRTYIRKEK